MRPRVGILTPSSPPIDYKKSAERERDDQVNAAAHMRCVWQQRRAKQNPAIQQIMEPGKFFAMRERQHRPAGASAQKCGGVQTKIISTNIQACTGTVPVTAAQPSAGGIAPTAPPITIFCGVAGFRRTV